MGILADKVDEEIKNEAKDNRNIYYNQNVKELYEEKYNQLKSISTAKMTIGRFYFIVNNDSNGWMKYCPIMLIDYKQFKDYNIGYTINFNFIPIEIRIAMFDTILSNFTDENQFQVMNFKLAYSLLLKYGYEYAIMEFNLRNILEVREIPINKLSKFLYSSPPFIKYDPNKLYDIWVKKLATKPQRHQQMTKANIETFFDKTKELNEEFSLLKNRIKRIQGDF